MTADKIFVGREKELEQFKKVLEEPQGQAVVVVGQRGMGKTWLINKMAQLAESHPELKCGAMRYEVTEENSVDSRLEIMIDDAFEAASNPKKILGGDDRGRKQWVALYKVLEAIPSAGKVFEAIRGLAASLKRDPSKDTRKQFIEKLKLISKKMPKEGRAIFIVDPEKYMKPDSDAAWAIVVRDLPEKIKFVFAQRPEDVLVDSETIGALDKKVVRIPEKRLGVLEKKAIDKLLKSRAKEAGYTVKQLEKALSRYKGHPYALGAALDLIEAGTKLEELPKKPKPTKFAKVQWKKVCNSRDGAIKLFKAYAILEVAVPDEVVKAVSGLDSDKLQHLFADKYLGGLLREEGYGKRIYHAILADYILEQIGEEEKEEIHSRVVEVYRGKLKRAEEEQTRPDALAAERLAEHVLAAEGEKAFVYAFVNDCYPALSNLGLLDAAINLSEKALGMVEENSEEEAAVRGNLGVIYQMRGELDKAEEMHKKALEIDERIGRLEGMANQYGNLGVIYRTRGELDKAEEMYQLVLNIEEKLGRPDSIANAYGNLGLIYRMRGELDKAEEMHKKALEIDERIGRLEGMASNYGNLGLIYQKRGELDKAEEIHEKALEINERIGRLKGMANQYGNLGVIYQMRGDLDKAEEMNRKALEIDERIGRLEGMASHYGNLGVIYQTRGDLERAKEMYQLVLNIEEKLGRPDSIANAYGNLGLIYRMSGELDKAEEMHKRSLEISEKLGRLEGTANQYGNLGRIYEERGDIEKAREYWEKARDLFERIGMPHMVEKVQGWIEGLK